MEHNYLRLNNSINLQASSSDREIHFGKVSNQTIKKQAQMMIFQILMRTGVSSLFSIVFFFFYQRLNITLITITPKPTNQIPFFFGQPSLKTLTSTESQSQKFQYNYYNMNTGNGKSARLAAMNNGAEAMKLAETKSKVKKTPKETSKSSGAPSSPHLDLIERKRQQYSNYKSNWNQSTSSGEVT